MTGPIIKQVNVRKRFTAEQKMALVQATLEPGVRVVEVARKYNVGVSTLIK
jgi:transposase-like protein